MRFDVSLDDGAARSEVFSPGVTNYDDADIKLQKVSYAYDYRNQLIGRQVDSNGDGTIDESGYFIYDGDQIILVLDSAGDVEHRLLWGPQVDQLLADENAAGDAFINIGSQARSVVSPPLGRSYWLRFGDVKHLTPKKLQTVIGDLASAGTQDGAKVIRVAKDSGKFVKQPPSNGAGIEEFICDEGVDILQSIDLFK